MDKSWALLGCFLLLLGGGVGDAIKESRVSKAQAEESAIVELSGLNDPRSVTCSDVFEPLAPRFTCDLRPA